MSQEWEPKFSEEAKRAIEIMEKEEYYPGLVVKAWGEWFLITKVEGHQLAVIAFDDAGKEIEVIFSMDEIKCLIGDRDTDFVGIGKERHKEEVIDWIDQYFPKKQEK